MIWLAVALIAIGNIYIGSLIAKAGLPAAIIGRRSPVTALFCMISWFVGLYLLYVTTHFTLTLIQAAILGGCAFLSYQYNYKGWGRGTPRVPWHEKLNSMVHAAERICQRHGWKITSSNAAWNLARLNQLHFDGGDYDILVQIQGDVEYELSRMGDVLLPESTDGQIDYDRATAQKLSAIANMLNGWEGHIGIVKRVEIDHDLSQFDREAFERLTWLADAIEQQWGMPRLRECSVVTNK
jgi:hypothetical protein